MSYKKGSLPEQRAKKEGYVPDTDSSIVRKVNSILFKPQFESGQGSARREYNINVVMKMIALGMSKQEIWFQARMKFTLTKFMEMYQIAEEQVIFIAEQNTKELANDGEKPE